MDAGNEKSGEYKVEAIRDSAVYVTKSISYLAALYYLVFWKSYLEEKNICEPASIIQHLRKLISSFYKNYPNKPTAISKTINTTPTMSRPTIKPTTKPTALKQKQGQPANNSNKQTKNSWVWFLLCFWLFWSAGNPRIKALSLKVTWLPNRPTYQNFYLSKSLSFKFQPHLWDRPLSIIALRTRCRFFSSIFLLG